MRIPIATLDPTTGKLTPGQIPDLANIPLDQVASPQHDVSFAGHKAVLLGDATADQDALNRRTGDGRYDPLGSAATAQAASIPLAQKAAASGVATLDSGTKLPVAQLPSSTPTVSSSSSNKLPTYYVPPPTGTASIDTAAINSVIAAVNATPGGRIEFADGTYAINAALTTITAPVHIRGGVAGIVPASKTGTVLSYTAGITGLTLGTAAQFSVVEDLYLKSASSSSGTDCGIVSPVHGCQFNRIVIDGFGQDGVNIDTTGGGNANNCVLSSVRAINNKRHGFYLAGGNSNVITLDGGCDASGNTGWGYYLNGTAKCVLVAPHAAGNIAGAYQDTGNSNYFLNPYTEGGTGANVTLAGAYAVWLSGSYGTPTITITPNQGNSVFTSAQWSDVIKGVDSATGHQWQFSFGSYSSGAFALSDLTNSKNIFDIDGSDTRLEMLIALFQPKAAPTYSASITPNAGLGPWQTITVTNGTAFTINSPSNPPGSSSTAELTIEVSNTSGGAMGAITWNAAYIFPTGAWANPANGKARFARFEWNGAHWICTALASADYTP